MPKGTPEAELLWGGNVSFFSIDTDLIQSAGYKFEEGALNQLPKQLPPTMELHFSEVVVREIVNHRMDSVSKATQQLKSASESLGRTIPIDMKEVDGAFDALKVEETARVVFRKRIEDYASRCRGGVLPIAGESTIQKIFDLYFSCEAPFAENKNKKSEFPDATSLILLEEYAVAEGKMGIVASGDEGWSAFAAESEHLYCVKSLDELTALFAATDELSKSIVEQVLLAVVDQRSEISKKIKDALGDHIVDSGWVVDEIYTGAAARVEGEAYDPELISYEQDSDSLNIWRVDGEPSSWVVEMRVNAKVELGIVAIFYAWDSIDREEIPVGSDHFKKEEEIPVELFISLGNVKPGVERKDWEIDIEIGHENYAIDVGEVEPDFR